MRKRIRRALALALLLCLVCTTGCGGEGVSSTIDDGAARFGAGKEEENYLPKNSGALLEQLIDQYSGSYQRPTGTQMTDDEYDNAKSKADDGSKDKDKGSDRQDTPVKNDTELLRRFLRTYSATEETMQFTVDPGYSLDLDKELDGIYTQLQRQDPVEVSCVGSWTWGRRGDEYLVRIQYTMGVDELKSIKKETPKLVKEAVAKLDTAGKSDYELVCQVNDYLCDSVYYPSKQPYAAVTHTAYGALHDGCAVCEGYACAAKLMLNELGVPCDIEVGTCSDGGGHAWNLVQVDGDWYQMDVTWNDGSSSRTDYLLVTDQYMQKSRSWDTSQYPQTPANPYTP